MRNKKKNGKVVRMIIPFVCLCLSVMFASPALAKYEAPQSLITIGSHTTGSLYVTYAAAFARILDANFKDVNINVQPGGSLQNMVNVSKKKAEFGISCGDNASMGYLGTEWAKGEKYNQVRAMFPAYPAITAIWTMADSPIKKFPQDVEGRKICTGPRGTASDIMVRQMFKMFNIKPKKIVNVSWQDHVGLMADRLVDITLNEGGHPAGFVQQLEVRHKLRFLTIDKDIMVKFQKTYPYRYFMTLQKVYEGMKAPQLTLGVMNFTICRKDLPDDFIYNVVKVTWENVDEIVSTLPRVFKETNYENLKYIPLPFHPGAIKYYKEIGIKLPEPVVKP